MFLLHILDVSGSESYQGWVTMTMTMEVIMMVNGDYNDGGNTYRVVSEDYSVGSNDVGLRDDVCDVRRIVVVKLTIFVDGDDIGDKDVGRNCCGGDDIGDKDTVLGEIVRMKMTMVTKMLVEIVAVVMTMVSKMLVEIFAVVMILVTKMKDVGRNC